MPTSVKLLAQPTATTDSVGATVRSALAADWTGFRASVAWAKLSGVRLIQSSLRDFAARPARTASVAVGVDNGGTSFEALVLLWRILGTGQLFVYQDALGPGAALAIVGSSNLTRGGLFNNHEASLAIELDLTAAEDVKLHSDISTYLAQRATPSTTCTVVDIARIAALNASGDLPSEAVLGRARRAARRASGVTRATTPVARGPRAPHPVEEPEPAGLPTAPIAPVAATPTVIVPVAAPAGGPPATNTAVIPRYHLIEVAPQHNGEVFLSYVAVTQAEPLFFGHPFSGWSTPKRSSNKAYPMLDPDPIVDIEVFDRAGNLAHSLRSHGLNVVDYEKNHEIRITVPQGLHRSIPDMSVLEIERDPLPSLDYSLRFFAPGSPQAVAKTPYLTETMPRGGAPIARRYGWR
jgi:hypothetical protein